MPLTLRGKDQKAAAGIITAAEHARLLEDLLKRYGRNSTGSFGMRCQYLRKAWLWRFVVQSAVAFKRVNDVLMSLLLLVTLIPLFLLVAILIKLTDGGPVLFWQTRIGRWGRRFALPKFRSMVLDAESLKSQLKQRNDHKTGPTFKMRRDPRTTRIGRFLRKSSVDELPQLWCVLKGELSLVGPRPALPDEVAAYTALQRRRLEMQPGLTCIWQVSGRGDVPFEQQVELDMQYIHSQSVWLDLRLALRTIPAILSGKGAY